MKYQLLYFLNKLSESNREFLVTILQNVLLQPFILVIVVLLLITWSRYIYI